MFSTIESLACSTPNAIVLPFTQLKIAQVVTALLVEQWCNNTVIMAEQYCSTNNVEALMKQQRLFTVVETGENNIDRISLFVIVIIVAQPC